MGVNRAYGDCMETAKATTEGMKMAISNQKAFDEGMRAGIYSMGLVSCPYAFGTSDFSDWLCGYRDGYK